MYGSRTHTLGGGLDGGVSEQKKEHRSGLLQCVDTGCSLVYSEECKLVYTVFMKTVIEACGV